MGFTEYLIYRLERTYDRTAPEEREQWLKKFFHGPDRKDGAKYNWNQIDIWIDDILCGVFQKADSLLEEYIRDDINTIKIEMTLDRLAEDK